MEEVLLTPIMGLLWGYSGATVGLLRELLWGYCVGMMGLLWGYYWAIVELCCVGHQCGIVDNCKTIVGLYHVGHQ